MSTDRLNRIIEEVKALTPEERYQHLERLKKEGEHKELQRTSRRAVTLKGTVKYRAPDFDAPFDEFKEYME